MKANLIYKITIVFIILVSIPAFSQEDPGGDPDAPLPIDGGISLLLAGGAALGVYALKKKKSE